MGPAGLGWQNSALPSPLSAPLQSRPEALRSLAAGFCLKPLPAHLLPRLGLAAGPLLFPPQVGSRAGTALFSAAPRHIPGAYPIDRVEGPLERLLVWMVIATKENTHREREEAVPGPSATGLPPHDLQGLHIQWSPDLGIWVVSACGALAQFPTHVGTPRRQKWGPPAPHTQWQSCAECVWSRWASGRFSGAASFWTKGSHSVGLLTLVDSQDLAADQENKKEDNQTLEVSNELTGCTTPACSGYLA